MNGYQRTRPASVKLRDRLLAGYEALRVSNVADLLTIAGRKARRPQIGFLVQPRPAIVITVHTNAICLVALNSRPFLVVRNPVGERFRLSDVQ